MAAPPPRPLWYTFGNHMHWVDMQWLWGEHVLPGSVEDMLRFCAAAGVRGNVNFDAIGYEKMAAEAPEALAKLRAAVQDGIVEPVGCSWGQPYGLFQGAESNVRQFEFGHRAVRRLLGVRPRAFWEEEFWFFPQLPQILRGFGYDGACLFFQWTWHTPEIPEEESEIIRWRGLDGSELPTLPRNGLNLHQWPEDFDPMLASPLLESLDKPALVQWIELMPSPDWMCRSEVLLPRMQELAADSRFELRPRTLSGLIEELDRPDAPVRAYTMDEVWHGMSLGKNGDAHPRASMETERVTLQAESLATMAAMLGRPYPSWDVYPHWELDEAWREQLAAQHHDNHECEGLCGFVGHDSFENAERKASRVRERSLERIARTADPRHGRLIVANPLPWRRDVVVSSGIRPEQTQIVRDVPGCGYRQLPGLGEPLGDTEAPSTTNAADLPPDVRLELTAGSGGKRHVLTSVGWPEGPDLPTDSGGCVITPPHLEPPFDRARVTALWDHDPILPAWQLSLHVDLRDLDWDPGYAGALALDFEFPWIAGLLHDHPFAQTRIEAEHDHPRKYPSGDWMTSEQWFEQVRGPFTSQRLVQVDHGELATLIVHDGSCAWQRLSNRRLRVVLNLNDPWDEAYRVPAVDACFWFLDGRDRTAAQRHRIAEELLSGGFVIDCGEPRPEDAPVGGGDPARGATPPAEFSALEVDGPLVATAFRRIGPHEGDHLPDWVARDMAAPHLVRLVELDGREATGTLRLGLPVTRALRTNMLAEPDVHGATPEIVDEHTVRVQLRPHEIQTLVLDLPAAAKQPRDLDARRKVWAQIHRSPQAPDTRRNDAPS